LAGFSDAVQELLDGPLPLSALVRLSRQSLATVGDGTRDTRHHGTQCADQKESRTAAGPIFARRGVLEGGRASGSSRSRCATGSNQFGRLSNAGWNRSFARPISFARRRDFAFPECLTRKRRFR